jgi:hypothetical protein
VSGGVTPGDIANLPARDPKVVEFTGEEALQGRDGFVDRLPTAVFGDKVMEQHGRHSFMGA